MKFLSKPILVDDGLPGASHRMSYPVSAPQEVKYFDSDLLPPFDSEWQYVNYRALAIPKGVGPSVHDTL
jgi:hypothetical protein